MSKLSKEIKEYISCPQINGKSYGRWGALNVHQKINIWNLAEQCELFEEIADKSMKELAKYKRAFEILKEFNDLPPLEEFVYCKEENYYYAEIEEYDDNLETYKTLIYTLGKEEYELLEELMKDAKD